MKSSRLLNYLMICIVLSAAILPPALQAADIEPVMPEPAPVAEDQKSVLAVHQFKPADGAVIVDASPRSWSAESQLWSLARHFAVGGKPHLVLLNGNRGFIKIFRLTDTGEPSVQTYNFNDDDFRCSSAQILDASPRPFLVLHDSFTGSIRKYEVSDDGGLNLASKTEFKNGDWKDKNRFGVFRQGLNWRYFGLDTWSGKVVISSTSGQKIAGEQWTRGYTSVDHIKAGETIYRLLYKASGDPYKEPGETEDKAGLLVIQKVGANGLNQGNTQAVVIGANWSDVRFIQLPNEAQYSVFLYNRKTGSYRVQVFNPQTGTVANAATATGNIGAKWTDFDTYHHLLGFRLVTLNHENVQPFYYDDVEEMARAVHDSLSSKVVGYQILIAQSGRVIFSRAWGKVQISPTAVDMTTRTRLDLGSVSKMITALTILKLASKPGIEHVGLDDPVSKYLEPEEVSAQSWTRTRTVKDLLLMTTGMCESTSRGCSPPQTGKCKSLLPVLSYDCSGFYGAKQTVAQAGGSFKRSYNNSNTVTAREVIEHATRVTTSPGIVDKTYSHWAKRLDFDPAEMSCLHHPNVNYFAACNSQSGCFSFNGKKWQQSKLIEGWSSNCSAGGWAVSSRHMLEFLAAIRYERILTGAQQDLLVNTALTSGGTATAFGWDAPWTYGSQKYLGKGGANGDDDSDAAFSTYITRLPNNSDAVLLINTAGVRASTVLLDSYVKGVTP
jgi:CubicO group peptidase (beta-lactamase class C family)